VEKRSAAIDYDHYIECQIKPIADSVLETIGASFDRIVSGQQDLFG
jgi:DNA polymerase-2